MADISGAPMQGRIRVLHVDDEQDQLSFARVLLEDADPEIVVESVSSPFEALDRLSASPDCVVTDYQMAGMDGIELARKIRGITDVPVILYTGRGSEEVASAAFAAGVNDYLRKEMDPGHFQVLARRIRHAVESGRTERILHESEEKYRTLLNANMDAVYVVKDGKYVYANREAARMLGYDDPVEILDRDIVEFYHPNEKERIRKYLSETYPGESPPTEYITRLIRRDGSEVLVEFKVSLIKYNGKLSTLAIGRDVVNREKMAAALIRDESEKSAILDTIPDGLSLIDEHCRYIWINKTEAARVGKPPAELIGKTCHEAFQGKQSPCEGCHVSRVFRTGEPEKWVAPYHDGKTWDIKANSVRDASGRVSSVIVLSRDITHLQKSQNRTNALHTSALKLSEATTRDDVWRLTFEALKDVMGFHMTGVGVIEDGVIRYTSATSLMPADVFEVKLEGRGVTTRAAKTRKTQLVRDARLDPDYIPGPTKPGTPPYLCELSTPIVVDGEAVAVLNVEEVNADSLTEDDARLTETLALHAASAISRIKQNVAERRYSHRLEVLNRHDNALDRVNALKDALVITYESLVSLGLTSPSISLLRDGVLSVQPVEGKDGIVPLNLPMDGPGITVRAAKTGKTQLVNDARSDPDLIPDPEGKPIGSELVAPVKLGDTVIGVLNLESDQPDAYTEEDAKIVEMLAAHFASSYERIQHIEHDARDNARIKALHGCAIRLGAATTVDEIWDIALKDLSEVLGFNTLRLGLVEGDKIKFHRFVGIDIQPDLTIPLENSILARVVKSKSTLLIPDTRLNPYYSPVTRNPDSSNIYLSELATPIIVNGRVFAVLNSESERSNDYGPGDQMLMETLASHVSNAITRVRMLVDLQRTVEQRTSELMAAEQMAMACRVSAMVAHDLRGPLQKISNASQLVRTHPERVGEMFSIINSAVEKSLNMLEEIRLNTREDQLRLKATDLPALIAESLKELSPPPCVEIDLRMGEGLGEVMVDPLKVNRVLDNLLRNAVEAMPGGGRLTVAAERVAGEIVLEVADTGPGLPEELMEKLFQPFLTTKSGGLGLGLPYCKKAVEAHGGSISVYSTLGEGATFTVRIPAS